eukprot:CAMPEP_0177672262 /NCGR_PEP_ID=MMETSP0447-20121125/25225_1 /TAXON_ID=0 /ORGANISM="Stygamoeba regulata, Strain BSH-02190019" /LENGTH=1272 /DNA_ID=CAMNT_0019179873 /DNA_START=33 /DNA_END=3849 /DNA_ORIENTATION=-
MSESRELRRFRSYGLLTDKSVSKTSSPSVASSASPASSSVSSSGIDALMVATTIRINATCNGDNVEPVTGSVVSFEKHSLKSDPDCPEGSAEASNSSAPTVPDAHSSDVVASDSQPPAESTLNSIGKEVVGEDDSQCDAISTAALKALPDASCEPGDRNNGETPPPLSACDRTPLPVVSSSSCDPSQSSPPLSGAILSSAATNEQQNATDSENSAALQTSAACQDSTDVRPHDSAVPQPQDSTGSHPHDMTGSQDSPGKVTAQPICTDVQVLNHVSASVGGEVNGDDHPDDVGSHDHAHDDDDDSHDRVHDDSHDHEDDDTDYDESDDESDEDSSSDDTHTAVSSLEVPPSTSTPSAAGVSETPVLEEGQDAESSPVEQHIDALQESQAQETTLVEDPVEEITAAAAAPESQVHQSSVPSVSSLPAMSAARKEEKSLKKHSRRHSSGRKSKHSTAVSFSGKKKVNTEKASPANVENGSESKKQMDDKSKRKKRKSARLSKSISSKLKKMGSSGSSSAIDSRKVSAVNEAAIVKLVDPAKDGEEARQPTRRRSSTDEGNGDGSPHKRVSYLRSDSGSVAKPSDDDDKIQPVNEIDSAPEFVSAPAAVEQASCSSDLPKSERRKSQHNNSKLGKLLGQEQRQTGGGSVGHGKLAKMFGDNLVTLATRVEDDPVDAVKQMQARKGGIPQKARKSLTMVSSKKCFSGEDAVIWMIKNFNITQSNAIAFGDLLLQQCLILPLNYQTNASFSDDENVFYRFQNLGQGPVRSIDVSSLKLDELATQLFHPQTGVKIKARRRGLRKYRQCFVGSEAVDWLCEHFECLRSCAVLIGRAMLQNNLFTPVSSPVFSDEPFLYSIEDKISFPIERVLSTLQRLRNNRSIDPLEQEEIEYVIRILSSPTGLARLWDADNILGSSDNPALDDATKSYLLAQVGDTSYTRLAAAQLSIDQSAMQLSSPKLMHGITDKVVSHMYKTCVDWNFDIFEAAEMSDGSPLQILGYCIFRRHGLLSTFRIPEDKLRNFLRAVEAGYKASNAYHNNTHAADVTQTLNFLLSCEKMSAILTPLDRLALIISAVVHDYDHPGVNNAFLVKTGAPLAVVYNDQSVLENHHAASCFKLLADDEKNILCNLSTEQRVIVRKMIIDLVLATDFSKHFALLGQFKSKLAAGGFDPNELEDRTLIYQLALKCSDISHTTKHKPLHLDWSRRVTTEFYEQGDQEKELNLTVSPGMDRHTGSLPKGQIGFITFLCMPLYEAFATEFPRADVMLQGIDANLKYWR